MNYETIADIFSANEKIRQRLEQTIANLNTGEAAARPKGEKWSIQQIVEHVSIVDDATARICTKLAAGARDAGGVSDGGVRISPEVGAKFEAVRNVKLEAPARIHPTGEISIADSLANLDETGKTFAALRPDLENFDLSQHRFPHPYFGDLTAAEWLVVKGAHEARHTDQIGRLIDKLRK